MVTAGGVELCTEAFGSPGDPAVLLIGGAAMSMDYWDDELCERLAAAGRHVVRYDHRDTGRSTSYPAGKPGYTSGDLTADVLRVLDGLGIERAHLVGVSMGGGIAQDVAARHPGRVLSLTLVATGAAGERSDTTPLPPPEPRLAATFTDPPPEPDWTDREAAIGYVVDSLRPYAGSLGLAEERARAQVTSLVERTRDLPASQQNHWLVVGGDGEREEPYRMADLRVPTLVMHGTDDPLFPLPHGEALAAEIQGATFVPLPGMGHEVPPPQLWDVVVPAITRHTSAASPA
jgi:pimeloyl-ACP methyl ester carboxylesterase